MAQLINLTSEALQATVRRLLPSQQGFGEDLQATNVVTPIIDLTPTAEGSVLRQDFQTAWDFATSQETFAANTSTNITSTPGFYKVGLEVENSSGSSRTCAIQITSSLSTKNIIRLSVDAGTSINLTEALIIFLRAGDTLKFSSDLSCTGAVYFRQIADVSGNIVPPLGFTFE